MVIEVAKHNASVVSVGENIIACSNITEAFIDVFSVDYGKDFAIIKPAHRYINNDPVIKVDVIVNEQLYKDVEFILVKSSEQGIFINENSLADGILIEQSNQQPEIVEEEATAAEFYAEQLDKVVENAVVDQQQPCINVVDLKQQAKQQHQNKITQHLQTIQEELSDQVSFELQQTKQAVLSETLNLQNKIQQDNAEMVQQNIESFRQQLKEWALSTEQHLTAYAEEAIADVEHQWIEKCSEMLATNKEQVLEDLQQEISITTINSMAAIKEKLSAEIAAHLKTVDEKNAAKDAAVDAFVQKQINQLHEQIEQSQMQKFDAKVADLLVKQHEWLQQNINETTNAYDEKLSEISNQISKVVAEASTDVVACIKNADASIEQKIQDALHQLNEKAQQLHEQRMQSIEQSVAQVLKENIADEQTDVISEARSSARNAVRDALASYKSDVSKDLNAQLMNIQKELHTKMQLYVQSYGGGGSVAMQFADGGTMNGTLNVATGQILSAGVDLSDIFSQGGVGSQTLSFNESNAQLTISPNGNTVSLSALSGGSGGIAFGNYLPLSGGTLTGFLSSTDSITVDNIINVPVGNIYSKSLILSADPAAQWFDESFGLYLGSSTNPHLYTNIYSEIITDNRYLTTPDDSGIICLTVQPSGYRTVANYGVSTPSSVGFHDKGDVYISTGDKGIWIYGVNPLIPNDWDLVDNYATQSQVQQNSNNISSLSSSSINWQNTYTTVNANSAAWGVTGASYLSALNDVSIPAPVNGQVLTYNTFLNKWTAGTPVSATGATGYYGSFYDERNQNATSPTSAYTLAVSGTFESNGISLSSNSIVFQYAGTYEIIYSLQIISTHNAQDDIQVWFAKNGVDIPNSNSVFTVAAKAGNVTGKIIMVTPFIATVNSGDSISIKWNAAATGISISSLPPNVTPTTPAAPGVIITVKQVTNVQVPGSVTANYLPLSGGTLTGAVSTNGDIEITDSTKGIILRSPSNFKYRVTVSDAGELITTLV